MAGPAGLVELSGGWTRQRLRERLLGERARDPRLAVGLDFAFSLPAWWLRDRGLAGGRQLWARAAAEGERWLREGEWPFWGRPWRWRRPELEGRSHHRATDAAHRASSPFKLVGPDSVGTGSIRGMALLHDLAEAGFAVWPFTAPGWPRLVEIYPRRLAAGARRPPAVAEDAFDAAVSALAMWRGGRALAGWPPGDSVEGAIWSPPASAAGCA